MTNLASILKGGKLTLILTDLPKIIRLLELAGEADQIIGELRADLSGDATAASSAD